MSSWCSVGRDGTSAKENGTHRGDKNRQLLQVKDGGKEGLNWMELVGKKGHDFLLLTQQRKRPILRQAEDDGWRVRERRQHSKKVGQMSGMMLIKCQGVMAKALPCPERTLKTPLPHQSSPSSRDEESQWVAVEDGRRRRVGFEETAHVKVDIEVLESLMEPENLEVSPRYVLKYSTRGDFPALRHIRETEPLRGKQKTMAGGEIVHGKRVGKTRGMIFSFKEQWQKPRRAPTGP